MSFARYASISLACVLAFAVTTARADGPLPEISQTFIHRIDPVDAAHGDPKAGTPEFAYREGEVVRYFTSAENCGAFLADKSKFPDADQAVRLAFFGADPVHRFPRGVRSPELGPLVAGDPGKYQVVYGQATFAFAERATQAAFIADPTRYIPAVGGYCLGAMSADRVTPGDPRNVYYVAEVSLWAVFGSPNGPVAWAKMSPRERREKYCIAVANYERKTGFAQQREKVAAR